MLSRELLREDPERVRQRLATRGVEAAVLDRWLDLDAQRRTDLVEVEELKRRRNEASREIGKLKQQGGDAAGRMAEVTSMKARIEELERGLETLASELAGIELALPNLPHESVPEGK
ncbi:MAG TPA: serine--tRNA ligase, partial [Thermoanaerobaculia bacterium]|nr:serine--tRNA ligase [Thermoanaerobaculia bacterium]